MSLLVLDFVQCLIIHEDDGLLSAEQQAAHEEEFGCQHNLRNWIADQERPGGACASHDKAHVIQHFA